MGFFKQDRVMQCYEKFKEEKIIQNDIYGNHREFLSINDSELADPPFLKNLDKPWYFE